MKMCLEIFGSLEIALYRIETFRYEAENDYEQRGRYFSLFIENRQPQGFILPFFFFTRNVSTVTFMKGG